MNWNHMSQVCFVFAIRVRATFAATVPYLKKELIDIKIILFEVERNSQWREIIQIIAPSSWLEIEQNN